MAPSSSNPHFHNHQLSPSDNVFEGPEKKLDLSFRQRVLPTNLLSTDSILHQNASQRCGLRLLTRRQIETILDAAACTILSVVSNATADAYLLSESSLFISDYRITIKTCGTTTLLHALPVILSLACRSLKLHLTHVHFSRVSYVFPNNQLFPHDSFEHEVSFLDEHLQTNGFVFQTRSQSNSNWFLYLAHFGVTDPVSLFRHAPNYCADVDTSRGRIQSLLSISESHQALEICMFDLEPTIMERFMFHDKPQCLGSDDIREGITTSTGIINLIHNHDVLDAFNFEPCGYSMNALADQSYYTIHISPEPDASYVSFETTAHVPSCPSFVAQVVKFFRPGKFTVSLIQHGKSARMTSLPSFNSLQVQKQLGFQYAVDEEANYDRTHLSPRFAVMAATFRSIERNNIGTLKMPTGHKMTYEEGLKIAEATARSHGAYFLGDNVSVEDVCTKYLSGKEAFQPTFVVNLTNLFHSFWSLQRIQQRNSSVHFRYSVNCNPDRAILAVLRDLEMDFEVANVDEIELLNELLVDRRRINLVQPILTAGLVSKFEMVGSVALFDIPPLPVQSALREANVDMEVCVNDFSFEETAQLLSHILNISENIKCISVETDYSSVKSLSDLQERLSDNLNQVERAVEDALGHNGEKVMFHIGGFDKVDVCGTRGDRKSIQSQTMQEMSCRKYSLSFDVSRFLVEDCASLVAQVIGRKCRKSPQSDLGEEVVCRNYYLRDGFYGSFSSIFMRQCHKGADRVKPKVLPRIPRTCEKERSEACGNPATDGTRQAQEPEYLSTLFGPTCDSMDHVWTGKLPALSVGDSILFPCMGAYSLSAMSQFNGFSRNVDVMHVLKQRGNQG